MVGFNNGKLSIGLYEKALPDDLDWENRLLMTRDAGYNFMEISIDKTDERLLRLKWDMAEINKLREISEKINIPLMTMCLSANRHFPIGSSFTNIQKKGVEIIFDAIKFSFCLGIKIIQIACYDVLDEEESTDLSRQIFISNLEKCLEFAASKGVMLAIENVDTDFGDSIDKIMDLVTGIGSPWLQIYPDIGNLAAMRQNIEHQLQRGINHIVAIHVKDTVDGVVRRIPFGEGIVDFISIFNTLKKIKFYGPILIEMWADDKKDNFEVISHARKWILEKIKQSGYLN